MAMQSQAFPTHKKHPSCTCFEGTEAPVQGSSLLRDLQSNTCVGASPMRGAVTALVRNVDIACVLVPSFVASFAHTGSFHVLNSLNEVLISAKSMRSILNPLLLSWWALVLAKPSATFSAPPAEQPGALDVYPPTTRGQFQVPLYVNLACSCLSLFFCRDHFRFSLPARTFNLRFFAYSQFATQVKHHYQLERLFYISHPWVAADRPCPILLRERRGPRVLLQQHRRYLAKVGRKVTPVLQGACSKWLKS